MLCWCGRIAFAKCGECNKWTCNSHHTFASIQIVLCYSCSHCAECSNIRISRCGTCPIPICQLHAHEERGIQVCGWCSETVYQQILCSVGNDPIARNLVAFNRRRPTTLIPNAGYYTAQYILKHQIPTIVYPSINTACLHIGAGSRQQTWVDLGSEYSDKPNWHLRSPSSLMVAVDGTLWTWGYIYKGNDISGTKCTDIDIYWDAFWYNLFGYVSNMTSTLNPLYTDQQYKKRWFPFNR